MAKRNKEVTRQRILDAAIDVFSDKGYNGALVDDITKRSDTSKGAFYFHFPSKKSIFKALLGTLVERIVAEVDKAVEENNGAELKIEAALETVLSIFSKHEKATRLLFLEATGLGKVFDEEVFAAHQKFAAVISGYLQSAIDDGSIAPLDTQLTAFAWLGAIHEVMLMNFLSPTSPSLTEFVKPLKGLLLSALTRIPSNMRTDRDAIVSTSASTIDYN